VRRQTCQKTHGQSDTSDVSSDRNRSFEPAETGTRAVNPLRKEGHTSRRDGPPTSNKTYADGSRTAGSHKCCRKSTSFARAIGSAGLPAGSRQRNQPGQYAGVGHHNAIEVGIFRHERNPHGPSLEVVVSRSSHRTSSRHQMACSSTAGVV
jgi:hypothetical protein